MGFPSKPFMGFGWVAPRSGADGLKDTQCHCDTCFVRSWTHQANCIFTVQVIPQPH
jgi:hypothetical protein